MKNCNLKRVIGNDELYRDPATGAILNTSETARELHMRRINRQKRERETVETLEGRVSCVENKLDKIHSQLDCLLKLLAKE